MALPDGVFKGLGLWRAANETQRDAITYQDKLRVGEHCFVNKGNIYRCIAVSSTGSLWWPVDDDWILTGSTYYNTGSIVIGATSKVEEFGNDIFFYVSGTKNGRGVSGSDISVFGGDLLTSGATIAEYGFSGSLTRLANGDSYLIAGPGALITSESNGSVTVSVRTSAVYHGFGTGSLQWSSTTWSDITNVANNIQDVISEGITRSGNQFTFVSAGYYQIDSMFNALGIDNYLGFRVTASNGNTLLQQTDYINMIGQHRANLAGTFQITGSNDWVALEYAQASGAVSTWQPLDPLDGENMRSVNISIHSITFT